MISFGIDIGTTTLRAAAIRVEIDPFGNRKTESISRPLCQFTPFKDDQSLDIELVSQYLDRWILENKIPLPEIGTLLFTGEAQRAPNAIEVAEKLTTRFHGLLSANLNPALETVLAAHGAGAVTFSRSRPGRPVLHIDIGGGTSNLAWIENGHVVDTACLDLGARKWIVEPDTGKILSVTKVGKRFDEKFACNTLVERANKMAEEILFPAIHSPFWVVSWKKPRDVRNGILSLSGGIIDLLTGSGPKRFEFGDIGLELGRALVSIAKENSIEIRLADSAGRATAFGVSAFSFQVSGKSIHHDGFTTVQNIPLYRETELISPQGEDELAIYFDAQPDTTLQNLIDRIKHWALTHPPKPDKQLVIILPVNLGLALGFQIKQDPTFSKVPIQVLDEISLGEEIFVAPIRKIDVRPIQGGTRAAVTLKTLLLF